MSSGQKPKTKNPKACTTCAKPITEENPHAPFCSERCSAVDLSKWLREEYRLADKQSAAVKSESKE